MKSSRTNIENTQGFLLGTGMILPNLEVTWEISPNRLVECSSHSGPSMFFNELQRY
jgi:hypothetical protein